MDVVNIHQAKTHLSRLLGRVSRGEEILIARNGKPVAKLGPVANEARRPGRLKGKVRVAADFDAPLPPALLAAFNGRVK